MHCVDSYISNLEDNILVPSNSMSKRGLMEVSDIPHSKKAKWSSNSTSAQGKVCSVSMASPNPFVNYGYGNNGSGSDAHSPEPVGSAHYNSQHLYSTPVLRLNTSQLVNGSISQLSSRLASAPPSFQNFPSHHQLAQLSEEKGMPVPYSAFPQYGVNTMGMNATLFNMKFPNSYTYSSQFNVNPVNLQSGFLSPALAVAASSGSNSTARTVYVGNLPATASVDELLNLVHYGPLELVRVLPEKSCVFLSFLDGVTASAFHGDAAMRKLTLHGQELKIGWGKATSLSPHVAASIQQSQATRNVYLGGLDEALTEERLREDLGRFGLIDQVKIVRDKNIAFVHFLSIATAIKVVAALSADPSWAGKRVNYGKDRCAYIPRAHQLTVNRTLMSGSSLNALQPLHVGGAASTIQSEQFDPYMQAASDGSGFNRTVYLGNIHPETTVEDLCNTIRGGVLQSIRYLADKHIAFVTFVESSAAFIFFQNASFQGITLNSRRLKVGWGRDSGPLPIVLAVAVRSGATRNVYIGGIEDFNVFNEEKLRNDFSAYGEIELVNFLKEKNCAFINFTNITSSLQAIDAMKAKPEYSTMRIAHGKDRCANPPRATHVNVQVNRVNEDALKIPQSDLDSKAISVLEVPLTGDTNAEYDQGMASE